MLETGLEPVRGDYLPSDFKSDASADSATPATLMILFKFLVRETGTSHRNSHATKTRRPGPGEKFPPTVHNQSKSPGWSGSGRFFPVFRTATGSAVDSKASKSPGPSSETRLTRVETEAETIDFPGNAPTIRSQIGSTDRLVSNHAGQSSFSNNTGIRS